MKLIVFILVSRTFQQSDDVTYDQHSVEGPATDESFSEPYENISEGELLGDEEALVETGSTAEVTDAIHTHEIEEYSDQQNDEASTIKVDSEVSEAPQINHDNDQVPTVNKDAEMLNSDPVQELPDVTIEPENLDVKSENSVIVGESSEKLDGSVQEAEIHEHVSKSQDEKNDIVVGNNDLLPPEPQISSDESEKSEENNLFVTDENSKDSDPNDLLAQEDAVGSQEQVEILEDAIIPQADDYILNNDEYIEANINSNEYTNPQELDKQNEEQKKPEEEIMENQDDVVIAQDESSPEDAKTSASENISAQKPAEETQEDASSSQEKLVVGPEEEVVSDEEIIGAKESEVAQEPAQSSQTDQEESSHVQDEMSAQETENAQIMNEVQEDVANSQTEQEEIDSLKEEVASSDEPTSTDVGTQKAEDGKEEAAIPHEDSVSPEEEALNPQAEIVSSQTESDLEEINNVSDNENIKPQEQEKQEEKQLAEKHDEVVISQEESNTDADENVSPKTTQDDVKIINVVQDDIASTQKEQDDVISPQVSDSELVDTGNPQDEAVTSAQKDELSEETHSETTSSPVEPADSDDVAEADKSDELSSSTVHETLPTTTFIIPYSPQISERCRDLECEFGYQTDLYGQLLCVCLNPCAVSNFTYFVYSKSKKTFAFAVALFFLIKKYGENGTVL